MAVKRKLARPKKRRPKTGARNRAKATDSSGPMDAGAGGQPAEDRPTSDPTGHVSVPAAFESFNERVAKVGICGPFLEGTTARVIEAAGPRLAAGLDPRRRSDREQELEKIATQHVLQRQGNLLAKNLFAGEGPVDARDLERVAQLATKLEKALTRGVLTCIDAVASLDGYREDALPPDEPLDFEAMMDPARKRVEFQEFPEKAPPRLEPDMESVKNLKEFARKAAHMVREKAGWRRRGQEADNTRRATIDGLVKFFEQTFGTPLGASRRGPGVRFIREFFKAIRERISEEEIYQLLLARRRHKQM